MRTEQLGAFIQIARLRSLNKASKALHLTQQALSVSMNNLEHEIGTPLLDRTSLGCGLTPAGERFLTFAENFLTSYQAFRDDIQREQETSAAEARQSEGILNIYINTAFYFFFHPQFIQNFCRAYPHWKISLTELPTQEVYERLSAPSKSGEWNIGVVNIPYDADGCFSPMFTPPENLTFHPLMRDGYLACVSRLSPLAGSRTLSLETLFKNPIVIGATPYPMLSPLHYLLQKRGKPDFVFSAMTPSLWSTMIAGNIGVGLLHKVILHDAMPPDDTLKELALIPIKENMEACTGYVFQGLLPEAAMAFIDLLPRSDIGATCVLQGKNRLFSEKTNEASDNAL